MKKGKQGCNQGENCEFFHPYLCKFEAKCHNIDCKRLHPKSRKINKEDQTIKSTGLHNQSKPQEQTSENRDEDFRGRERIRDSSQMDCMAKVLEEVQKSILAGQQFMERTNNNVNLLMKERESPAKWTKINQRTCCSGH